MLTDIFADRYSKRAIWQGYSNVESKLLVQCSRILTEQVIPLTERDGKPNEESLQVWSLAHNRLSMELGVQALAELYMPRRGLAGQELWVARPINDVCTSFLTEPFEGLSEVFMKRRISFVELAFRFREEQIARITELLPENGTSGVELINAFRAQNSKTARAKQNILADNLALSVAELNERFRRADAPLNYHNGYIQITTDALVQARIAQPFWALVKDAKWTNVSTDMAEALDRRDTGGRDPAFYAAKSLESTIKIISDEKKWSTGKEKGVSDYLNHLEAKAHGAFVERWERQLMQKFFSDVRNALGHGPGSGPMPNLNEQQTDYALEFCMSWIKSLIKRL